jgi:hypothetical protein
LVARFTLILTDSEVRGNDIDGSGTISALVRRFLAQNTVVMNGLNAYNNSYTATLRSV